MRLWTMQSVAHGADFISYFRWRTAPYGTEIYWHGLNDYDNRPNRRLSELKHIHREFSKLAEVAGSRYEAKVAILTDTLNEWDGERDLWHGPMNKQSVEAIFAAAQHTHTPLDIVNLSAVDSSTALSQYKLVFYPHAAILTDETAAMLREYCQNGGTVIMGARTGYKDAYGRCPMRPMPGPAAELCGVTVKEYTLPHPQLRYALVWGERPVCRSGVLRNPGACRRDGNACRNGNPRQCGGGRHGLQALCKRRSGILRGLWVQRGAFDTAAGNAVRFPSV